MKNNRTYLLAGILVVLIVIAYFLTRKSNNASTEKVTMARFFDVDSASVDKLEFLQNGKKFVLSKVNNEWRMTEPVDYKVMPDFVTAAVSNLKNYKLSSIVSENPSMKINFGFVDTNQVTLTVYQGGAAKGTFLIGNSTAGASQTYLKLPDNDKIYLADDFLRNNFVKSGPDEWRDKSIVSIPSGMIKSIQYTYPSESFTLTKDSAGSYKIGSDKADSGTVAGLLNLLQNFNTQSFKDTVLAPDTKFTTVKVDWGNTTQLDFLKQGDSTNVNYLLKVTGNNQLFQFNGGLADGILKHQKDFIKK